MKQTEWVLLGRQDDPLVEKVARAIAVGHANTIVGQKDGNRITVASASGYCDFPDSPDLYSEDKWRDYRTAARLALGQLQGNVHYPQLICSECEKAKI